MTNCRDTWKWKPPSHPRPNEVEEVEIIILNSKRENRPTLDVIYLDGAAQHPGKEPLLAFSECSKRMEFNPQGFCS
jgi:hypothetical protein